MELPSILVTHLCILHRRQKITHVCVDSRCTANPFLCNLCLQENKHKLMHAHHEQCISLFSQSLAPLSQLIESSRPHMENMFDQTMGSPENTIVLKRLESAQKYYQSMQNHIQVMKSQVEKDIDQTSFQISRKLSIYKQNIISALDNYLKISIQNLQTYKLIAQPIVTFNKSYKNYSNINNLNIKLSFESKQKSTDWFLGLKRILANSSKILEKPQQYYSTLSRSTLYLKEMCEQGSPKLQSERVLGKISKMLDQIIGEMIVLREVKPLQIYLNEGGREEKKVINRIQREVHIN